MTMRLSSTHLGALRQRAGYSQSEVGERLGLSQKNVSNYERGMLWPSPELLRDFATLYGCPVKRVANAVRLDANAFANRLRDRARAAS